MESSGDDGKVPTTILFIVAGLYFFTKILLGGDLK